MNENENNFDALRQLLKLKRHELPPPGYFNNFSSQVVTRIRLGDSANSEGVLGTMFVEAPGLLRFIQMFTARPAVAGVFASVLFLLLVVGIVYSDYSTPTNPENFMQSQAEQISPISTVASVTPGFLDQSVPAPSGLVSSTNPVFSFEPVDSQSGGQNSLLQPVGYTH